MDSQEIAAEQILPGSESQKLTKLSNLHQQTAACSDCQPVTPLQLNSPEDYYILGDRFQQKGYLHQAMYHFEKALELNPNFIIACYKLVEIFIELGNIDRAISYLQQAHKIDPADKESFYYLGMVLQAVGSLEAAKACWEKSRNPSFIHE